MWSPRWSPDGRFIAGLSGSRRNRLMLYDVLERKQTLLLDRLNKCPSWSGDGEFLYFSSFESDYWVWRMRMRDRKMERITDQTRIRVAGWGWYVAGANNSFITARDAGTDEIYALDWEAP
jgi:Tol biopolymer transport system component